MNKIKWLKGLGVAIPLVLSASMANATLFTSTTPDGLDVTTVGASTVGGIVVALEGTNGSIAVSQLEASSLFVGFYDDGSPVVFRGNPGTIGIQTGFAPGITGALGGGLVAASIRFTLYDGDSGAGDFDDNGDNSLLVNGIDFGFWDVVEAQNTDGLGNLLAGGFSGGGFRDDLLDTGWFHSTDAADLAALFASIVSTEEMVFEVSDVDPFDNFYDFTLGIDNSLINVGQGPGVIPPGGNVPEPGTLLLIGAGLAGLGFARRKKA